MHTISQRGYLQTDENSAVYAFTGGRHNKFVMFGDAFRLLGVENILHFFDSSELFPKVTRWLFPVPINGLWNMVPSGSDDVALGFRLLAEGGPTYLSQPGAVLCFDAAGESFPIVDETLRYIHEQLVKYALPADRVLILTSAIDAPRRYEKWCKAAGVEAYFTPVPFHVQLYYLAGMYRSALAGNNLEKMLKSSHDCFSSHHRKYHFLSLNFTPRLIRYAHVLSLMVQNHLRKGLVSFFGPTIDNGALDADWKDLEWTKANLRSLCVPEEAIGLVEKLHSICPLVIEENNAYSRFEKAYYVQDHGPYQNSYFSFVTESDFTAGGGVRLTEKIFKPLAHLHPLVVLGPTGSLRELRKLGFQTFHPIIRQNLTTTKKITRFDFVARPTK